MTTRTIVIVGFLGLALICFGLIAFEVATEVKGINLLGAGLSCCVISWILDKVWTG